MIFQRGKIKKTRIAIADFRQLLIFFTKIIFFSNRPTRFSFSIVLMLLKIILNQFNQKQSK